jgi:hypothetical protein
MDRWIRWAPVSGLIFAALVIASFAVSGETPDVNDSGRHVINFFTDNRDSQLASGILGAYASVFFLFWAGTLRGHIRRLQPGSSTLAAMSFGGGIAVAVGGAIFSGITVALSDAPDKLDPGAAQALNVLNNDLFPPLIVGVAVFMIANGLVTLRWGILPAWLGWIALLIGVVALTPIGFFAALAMVIWTIVVSILLLVRGRSETTTAATPPPASSVPA